MILYIDPGTGSMLFTVLLGLVTTVYFFLQKLVLRIKVYLSGGRKGKVDTNMMPFVIFSDDKRYWEYFKGVCRIFEEKGRELVYWTCSKDDPALNEDYKYVKTEYIGNINAASVRLNRMKAGICLSTTPGLDVYQWKRSKDTRWYVHILHTAGDARVYRMFGMDFYDAVLVTGEHQIEEIRQLEEVRKQAPKEISVAGEPHIDNLYERFKNEGISGKKGFTVLLAPSWGSSGILARFGEKIIRALIATGYHIIIRPHPQSMQSEKEMMDRLMTQFPDDEQIEWNFDNDNYSALCRADIMISDFSGVIWDYMFIFERPVIYADVEIDDGPYDIYWVNDKRWPIKVLEKNGIRLEEEKFGQLKEIIDEAVNSESIKKTIEEARSEAWANPGHAAEKMAAYLFSKYDELECTETA